jgi:hypothetical protein
MGESEVAEAPAAEITPLRNVRVVLVRPRGAANIGAAARAMKNLGVSDLALVRPAVARLAAADRMAVHARDLLRDARVVEALPAAVADCHLVVGTTCRTAAIAPRSRISRRWRRRSSSGPRRDRWRSSSVPRPRAVERRPAALPTPVRHRHERRVRLAQPG